MKFLRDWRESVNDVMETVVCRSNRGINSFCHAKSVMIDFSKASVSGSSRAFKTGFFNIQALTTDKVPENALQFLRGAEIPFLNIETNSEITCDIHETRPTFLNSNDDSYNLSKNVFILSIFSICHEFLIILKAIT